MEKIVSDSSISAVLGHFSSGVGMTAGGLSGIRIALINGSAAHMDFAKVGDCIFRNNAIYTTDANTMLQIMDYLGVKKIGTINPNNDAGVAVTTAIQDMLERYGDQYGGELVLAELYEDGTVDFTATVAKFQQAGVEAIYSSGPYSLPHRSSSSTEKDKDVKFVMSAACFPRNSSNWPVKMPTA